MYKEKIIVLIASRLSEANCERIWKSVTASLLARDSVSLVSLPNERFLAMNKDWDESLHPRHEDGRFSPKGNGRANGGRKDDKPMNQFGRTPTEYAEREIRDFVEKFNGFVKEGVESVSPWTWKRPDAHLIDPEKDAIDILNEIIDHRSSNERFKDQVNEDGVETEMTWGERAKELKKRLQSIRRLDDDYDSKEELEKKVQEFYDCEAEIDALEESWYNPSNPEGRLKFSKTDEGKKARMRYAYLKRRRNALDREIDWDKVPEPEAPKMQDGTPRDYDSKRN